MWLECRPPSSSRAKCCTDADQNAKGNAAPLCPEGKSIDDSLAKERSYETFSITSRRTPRDRGSASSMVVATTRQVPRSKQYGPSQHGD